ncbi:MAG TPA: hypothetical protein VM661_17150 [Candidatus Sulfotelmatobacter sp.]|jgi:hypothetical protein|nr:hypothetical protein [Candidatus Sulfotelmatobacter sp.]
MKAATVALYAARLGGLAALVLGLAFRLGQPVPIHAHMAAGALTIFGLWTLAVLRIRRPGAWLALAVGLLIPPLGLIQMHESLAAFNAVTEWLHPGLAVVALGLVEGLARKATAQTV